MTEPKLLDQYRERLLDPLRTHRERVKVLHERDLMIRTHVLNNGRRGVRSPLDANG